MKYFLMIFVLSGKGLDIKSEGFYSLENCESARKQIIEMAKKSPEIGLAIRNIACMKR